VYGCEAEVRSRSDMEKSGSALPSQGKRRQFHCQPPGMRHMMNDVIKNEHFGEYQSQNFLKNLTIFFLTCTMPLGIYLYIKMVLLIV
jgi:hypothetical protein